MRFSIGKKMIQSAACLYQRLPFRSLRTRIHGAHQLWFFAVRSLVPVPGDSRWMLHVRTPLRYVLAKLMRAADPANLSSCTYASSSADFPPLRASRVHKRATYLLVFGSSTGVQLSYRESQWPLVLGPQWRIFWYGWLGGCVSEDGQTRLLDSLLQLSER
jgi:hypothetical protein